MENTKNNKSDSIKIIDDQLKIFRDMLINSYLDDNGKITGLSLHNIGEFQNGTFSRPSKGNKLKMQLGFPSEQFVSTGCSGIPIKPNDWRVQPLILCVWKQELKEDEK